MRPTALAACMLVAFTGLVRGEGLSPADLARKSERSDAPELFESPYHIRSALVLARNTAASYDGSGEAGRTLRFPGSPAAFARYDDYRDALRRVDERTGMAHTIGHMF